MQGTSLRRVAFARGHTAAVCSLSVSAEASLLASGAEDGRVALHALPPAEQQLAPLATVQLGHEEEAVAALAFLPSSVWSAGQGGVPPGARTLLLAAVGAALHLVALLPAGDGESQQQQQQASCKLRPLWSQAVAADDLACLAINAAGSHFATADDAGDVAVYELRSLLQHLAAPQKQPLAPARLLAGAHAPLASCVAFRRGKPWLLLSGGMDSRVAAWDFSRPRRRLAAWAMPDMRAPAEGLVAVSTPQQHAQQPLQGHSHAPAQQRPEAGPAEEESGAQLHNPSFVHALAGPCEAGSSNSSSSSCCSSRRSGEQCPGGPLVRLEAAEPLLRRLLAVARGDGLVAVFDADPDAPAQPAAPAGSSRARAGKAQLGQPSPQRARAGEHDSIGASTSQKEQQQPQQQQQPMAVQLQPGFSVCLGPGQGGHVLPASVVVFLPLSGGHRLLLSGGEDGRLLLWDWAAAGLPPGGPPPLLAEAAHRRKVNALAAWLGPGGHAMVAVADTSPRVSLYRVRLAA